MPTCRACARGLPETDFGKDGLRRGHCRGCDRARVRRVRGATLARRLYTNLQALLRSRRRVERAFWSLRDVEQLVGETGSVAWPARVAWKDPAQPWLPENARLESTAGLCERAPRTPRQLVVDGKFAVVLQVLGHADFGDTVDRYDPELIFWLLGLSEGPPKGVSGKEQLAVGWGDVGVTYVVLMDDAGRERLLDERELATVGPTVGESCELTAEQADVCRKSMAE